MGALSHDQFAEHVNAGGATRLLHTNESVPLERGNYAVSDPYHESVVPAPVTGTQVAEHHAGMLRDPRLADPRASQGGWREDETVYLDSSKLVAGRRNALVEGKKNGQIAVFSHGRALDEKPSTEVYMRRSAASEKARMLEKKTGLAHTTVGHSKVGWTVERARRAL